MKYLYIILAIIGLATIPMVISLLPDKKLPRDEVALSINGRDITKAVASSEGRKHGYHADQKTELFDTLITRELLIQEAERQAINKEETFRSSLKNYYENSLVKILLDRQNSKLQVSVSEADIDNYAAFLGKIITFTRLDKIPDIAPEAQSAKGITNTALFTDLATPVRLLLSSLQPGQFATRFDTGNEKYALRLDSMQAAPVSPDAPTKAVDRQRIREMLEEYQKEQQMNRWLLELKQKATITIHKEQE